MQSGLSDPEGGGWKGFGAERLVVSGVNALLGIAFLDVGVERSRSVCRLTAAFGQKAAHGTASADRARSAADESSLAPRLGGMVIGLQRPWRRWFDYELDQAGQTRQLTMVPCDPQTTIAGDRRQDWAMVPVQLSRAPTRQTRGCYNCAVLRHPAWTTMYSSSSIPTVGRSVGLSHNLVRYVDDDVLQYSTDTKAGSSGAPVFNNRWEVVGLHRPGGGCRRERGKASHIATRADASSGFSRDSNVARAQMWGREDSRTR